MLFKDFHNFIPKLYKLSLLKTNMGTALITIKLMPESLETNIEEIKTKAKELVESKQGKNTRFEEVPIAFGLKAINVFFDLDEEIELEPIENSLGEIQGVNSSQVTDMRRAFG